MFPKLKELNNLMPSRLSGLQGLAIAGLLAAGATAAFAYSKARRANPVPPEPHWRNDPQEAEDLLNIGIRDSMAASDPPSIVTPDVNRKNH